MLKIVNENVWAFDLEWVPDPVSGRRAYALPQNMPDHEVVTAMWREGGATEADPRPFLKTVLCRVVSFACVRRQRAKNGEVSLALRSLPLLDDPTLAERDLVHRVLSGIGRTRPQLVGFNSARADLPILIQRGLVHALHEPAFGKRPNKPWEGSDYFVRGGDSHVDVSDLISGWGKGTPSLHEIAIACGIPGKIDTDGRSVVDLWQAGRLREIVQYNECDALTTYLLWLRVAHFSGQLTSEGFADEERQLEGLLTQRPNEPGNEHLARYLDVWRALRC